MSSSNDIYVPEQFSEMAPYLDQAFIDAMQRLVKEPGFEHAVRYVMPDVKVVQALEAARQLSAYIHYTFGTLHESMWIAQRQGHAKDSNDVTQGNRIFL